MSMEELKIIKELIEASKPFTGDDVVDETCGTVPLMIRLEEAIKEAEAMVAV